MKVKGVEKGDQVLRERTHISPSSFLPFSTILQTSPLLVLGAGSEYVTPDKSFSLLLVLGILESEESDSSPGLLPLAFIWLMTEERCGKPLC